MPTREINYQQATQSLTLEYGQSKYSNVVSTNSGLALVEIQGELNLPAKKPEGLKEEEERLFIERKVPSIYSDVNDPTVDLVKFGRLELDERSGHAVLFISTSQRLEGKVEKLDHPLGILRISREGDEMCELLDVIERRVVFRNRPLPIM
ncbi:DEKNAAC104871 [Brettanomyces naardenensis]|uniref:DEKNAAC104871 n=1 Tax=Brettanomyces naardenensis TaxID=13370 RepID=A0A448YSD7_BRENA|nr:DEKNAAC104871 [Brettanomyces naardenensis]